MRKFSVIMCTLLLLAGCAKNEIIIYGQQPDNNESGSGSSQEDNTLITFSASLESRNVTRSMSPMPKGVISQVYSFKTTDSRLTTPSADGLFITASAGMLTGVGGYKMYLANGSYNMYALSTNSSANPPVIYNGETGPLKNGVDYLWWENLEQDVTTSQVHVPIVFKHVAAQVVIDISAGESLAIKSLVSATILPPLPVATLQLQTGTIESTQTYDTTPFKMGINKLLAQAIILPTSSKDPMALTLQILVDGEPGPRTYNANIPIPGKFAGGYSYIYSAIIDGNTISFSEASIKDWIEVDESGNPLYPQQ